MHNFVTVAAAAAIAGDDDAAWCYQMHLKCGSNTLKFRALAPIERCI